MDCVAFVIITVFGAPRTKKNHSRIVRLGKRLAIIPSAEYKQYEASAVAQLRIHWTPRQPIERPVNVAAVIYREKATGDLVNYLQAVADVLEAAHVVQNDKWIVGWDGSRMDKDATRPRVVLEITDVAA